MKVETLFSPIELSGIRLRNRIVHASMTTRMSAHGGVTEPQLRYFANRARGGAAMIVTEPLTLSVLQDVPHKTRAWHDDHEPHLKRFADAVEAHDCRLVAQIQDPGRARHQAGKHLAAWAPSALPDDLSWSMPREMRLDEISRLIEDIADSSRRLQRCGFSGVELSCGHGHLFHQFLSPRANLRTDAYGGSWEGRTRLIRELVQAIRQACGERFIVGLKLPGDDGYADSIGVPEAVQFTPLLLASRQVSYVAFAQGTHGLTLDAHVPDRFGPREPYREMQRSLRPHLGGVPMIALGRIVDPAQAHALLDAGEAELVGLGRTLVADPAWPIKAATGRAHDIRYCLSCNTCWESIITRSQTLACVNNPRVAQPDEVDGWPAPAGHRLRVVVVGAGIAGMEAAWVAAARGHDVRLLSRGTEAGGKARLRSVLPGGEEVSSIYDYQLTAAQRAGVEFAWGVEATADGVLSLAPDRVVLATGGTMTPPTWLPREAREQGWVPDLREAMESLRNVRQRQSGTAVVFDMDHTEGTYASALHLASRFERVVLLTPRPSFADDMALVTRQGLLRRMAQAGIERLASTEPVWDTESFESGRLSLRDLCTGASSLLEDVVLLTYSTPRTRQDALREALRTRAPALPVHCIGDCASPRDMLAATSEGHALGLAL
jgi:2,4-dienoyl-CoA reductase-like NADH-dependent reductase (Old Yellow Enzyme family)